MIMSFIQCFEDHHGPTFQPAPTATRQPDRRGDPGIDWRGFARLIDLTLIVLSTSFLAWLMINNFDWRSLFEALNMNVPHPTIDTARRVASILIACPIGIALAMIASQAAWGVTPGKWLCPLKTVRTSLRPCGFPASLAREIVFFVDCCNFLYWAPGILSIAFTDKRSGKRGVPAMMKFIEGRGTAHPPFAPPFLKAGKLIIGQTANILLFLGERHGLRQAGRIEHCRHRQGAFDFVIRIRGSPAQEGSQFCFRDIQRQLAVVAFQDCFMDG